MSRRIIKWALLALGALVVIGAVTSLATTAAAPEASTEAAASISSDPTPEPTVDPTPEPTPLGAELPPRCSEWLDASDSSQAAYAAELLATHGDEDAPVAGLVADMTEICSDVAGEANPAASWIALIESDARFAEATPKPTPKPTPKATPVPTPEPTPVSYSQLDARGWDLLVKNPDDYLGNAYQVWACITQFDAATGEDMFLAQALQGSTEYWYSDADNTFFSGGADQLRDFVEGDVVSMNVTSLGSFSYDTQIGGNTTVPMFAVDAITLQGSCE